MAKVKQDLRVALLVMLVTNRFISPVDISAWSCCCTRSLTHCGAKLLLSPENKNLRILTDPKVYLQKSFCRKVGVENMIVAQ